MVADEEKPEKPEKGGKQQSGGKPGGKGGKQQSGGKSEKDGGPDHGGERPPKQGKEGGKPGKGEKGEKGGKGGKGQEKPAAKKERKPVEVTKVPALKARYFEQAVPAMMEKFKYANKLAVPRVVKVSINMGLGKAMVDKKIWDQALDDISRVSGQKAVITQARKSVSNFKVRKGFNVGARTTLRGRTMWEFLFRFVTVALPRLPDFRGLNSKSFDGRGNLSVGLKELVIFPEIDPDKSTYALGMDVTVVTTARSNEEGLELLKALGFPFQRA
jgi:large subunit ribosomal protein L5